MPIHMLCIWWCAQRIAFATWNFHRKRNHCDWLVHSDESTTVKSMTDDLQPWPMLWLVLNELSWIHARTHVRFLWHRHVDFLFKENKFSSPLMRTIHCFICSTEYTTFIFTFSSRLQYVLFWFSERKKKYSNASDSTESIALFTLTSFIDTAFARLLMVSVCCCPRCCWNIFEYAIVLYVHCDNDIHANEKTKSFSPGLNRRSTAQKCLEFQWEWLGLCRSNPRIKSFESHWRVRVINEFL